MLGGEIRSVVPWSRLMDRQELLLAINTDRNSARTAWVIIDHDLHEPGSTLCCLYSTLPGDIGRTMEVKSRPDDARVVQLTVPAAGFVMYAQLL